MNIHPLIIHFPIALLTVYAICELIWSRRLAISPSWIKLKGFLVIVGTLAATAAYITGDWAQDALRQQSPDPATFAPLHNLIEVHSQFATFSLIVFWFLAVAYIIKLLRIAAPHAAATLAAGEGWKTYAFRFVARFQRVVIDTPFVYLFAIGGLLLIMVTGALGGSLVYGPDVDPFVTFVYKWLIK